MASALYSETATLGAAFRGDIEAPEAGELADEYPYIGSGQKTLALAKAAVTEAVGALDDSLTQQDIFNRLTANGAAQGLVLYNGQLYINASYIQSGTLVLGGLNNQNGTLKVLNAAGQEIGTWTNDGINIDSGSVQLSKTSSGQTGRVTIQESVVNPIEVEYEDSSGRILTTVGGINPIGIFYNGEECRIGPHSILFQNSDDGAWFYAINYNGVISLYFKGDALINGALNVAFRDAFYMTHKMQGEIADVAVYFKMEVRRQVSLLLHSKAKYRYSMATVLYDIAKTVKVVGDKTVKV